jgi:hypothetical protein
VKLDNFETIKQFFSTLKQKYLFVSPTNFNVLGMEKWVKNWKSINLIDVFDGHNSSVMLPNTNHFPVFKDIEDVNAFLLNQENTIQYLKSDKNQKVNIIFLFFSPELEAQCKALNATVILPEHHLVKKVDSKIVTTQIGNKADVQSVPNCLGKIANYLELLDMAEQNHLGRDWVVQLPYGDSGKTTYFISNPQDFDKVKDKISNEEIKVMKRIRCISTAIEGCATRQGTFVGPLLGELIGVDSMTPYPGGWCGNEFNRDLFGLNVRQKACELTERLGDQLYKEGYRGYFEVDFLLDLDTHQLYLGELNPRLTGITAKTNLAQFSKSHLPLFLFHLLEYSDINFSINPSEYNEASIQAGIQEDSGQLIVKHLSKELQYITAAPKTGVYEIVNTALGIQLKFLQSSNHPGDAQGTNQIYLFRILSKGDYAYQGADLVIIFTNFSFTQKNGSLSKKTHDLISAARCLFELQQLTMEEAATIERHKHAESQKTNY